MFIVTMAIKNSIICKYGQVLPCEYSLTKIKPSCSVGLVSVLYGWYFYLLLFYLVCLKIMVSKMYKAYTVSVPSYLLPVLILHLK